MLAAELMLVVYASFALRKRIGPRNWRRLHWATYAIFAAATVHGLAAGTDTAQPWAFACTSAAVGSVAAATAWRALASNSTTKEDTSMTTYRIEIDQSLCSGFGDCVDEARRRVPSRERDRRRRRDEHRPAGARAADACPMGAITVRGAEQERRD